MALSAPKCNLKPVVELIVEWFCCICCKVNLDYMNENIVMFYFLNYAGLKKPFERSKDGLKLSPAINGICWQTDHVEVFWISQVFM